MARQTVEERFWSKVRVDVSTRCYEWTAARTSTGYGAFMYEGRTRKAHRMAWYLEHGQWPVHTLDHLCRNPLCVNPDHLEDVTDTENVRRGVQYRHLSDQCVNGHEFTPDNTSYHAGVAGRRCLACGRERQAAYYRRKKAKALA